VAWRIDFSPSASKEFKKLDKPIQKTVDAFLQRLSQRDDPRTLLEPYSGPLAGFWKKRVGNYRLICEIQDAKITVLVVKLGHRSGIYR
jgi:mRNA interferase RelE/StbE